MKNCNNCFCDLEPGEEDYCENCQRKIDSVFMYDGADRGLDDE